MNRSPEKKGGENQTRGILLVFEKTESSEGGLVFDPDPKRKEDRRCQ